MDQRRQRLYRTPAIVLKRQDFGEADRILTLFTPDVGKLRVIAKGVRKITSRKSGHVELFTYSHLLIAKGRNLDIVTQAETLQSFRAVREDLSRIMYAYYIAELVDQFTEDRDENRRLFDLLLATLQALGETDDVRRTTRFFELRFLEAVGYRPQLFRCVQCNREIEPVDNFFGLEAGGVLCPDCIVGVPERPRPELAEGPAIREGYAGYGESPSPVRPLSLNALKVLRFMQREPYPAVEKLNIRRETHGEMERLMHRYLTHLLERDLKSVEFLGTLAVTSKQ
ncbi:MAG: DNA repair protein RecO [Anaerolineae bacterium]